MKLKHFILALVATLSGFAFTANAQTSVSTFDELKAALGTETQIEVVGDIAVEEAITIPSGTTVNGDGTLHVRTKVYVVSTETPYPGVTYNKTATKNGAISGTVSCKVVYEISLDGGENWFTDTTNGKAQAVTVKKDGTKTISTSFQSAFTDAKCGEIVHMLKDAYVQSTNSKKNNGPLRSYYGLILEGNGHTIYTEVESSGASNEYSTIKFTSYLAGTGADVRPVLKNVTIDSQNNAKADLDIVSGDVTFTVSLYNVNLLGRCVYASFPVPSYSLVLNKSNVKLFDSSIPSWDAGSANAIEFYSGSYSLSFNNKCKVYGGSFSKSVANYVAANHEQKQVNGKYVVTRKEGKVETAPTVNTIVEGEVANELVANAAAKDEVELPAGVANFTVQLTAVESENDATTKVTFTVTPSNVVGEKVSALSEAITFRLPVPAAWSGKAKVSHEGEELGVYDINEENGAKYVEVESANFSEFSVEPVPSVAKIGDAAYATLADAVAAAQAGDEIVVIAEVADVVVDVTKNLTISGSVTLNNVGINANGADALTVKGLTFTGNSWINSGTAETLTVSGVTATVAPNNTTYTNSRSAFISLGRSEQQTLALTVENCNITVTSSGPDAILGWAAITKATITGNVIKGSSNGYFTNADAIKFMAIADGAEFEIKNNEIWSNYNGIVFGQNTTRANAYSVYADANKFVGGADHIWIEVSGANTVHATVNATSANTVNGNAFTIDDIKYHSGVIKTWSSYAGVDVVTNENGKVIGGTLAAFSNAESVAEGYEMGENGVVAEKAAVANVAKVGDVEYADLQEAINAAQNGETIILIADVELTAQVVIPEGKELTLDLNGKSISMEESIIATAYAINNLGNLTITDGVGGGSVNARGMYNGYGDGDANVTSAIITILGGTFNAKGTNGGAAIFNYGTANVNGGKFTSIGGYSLNNQAGAKMNITDGVEVTGGIYNNQDAELTVDGGNISNNRSGCHTIYAWNATVTVNGGSIHNENSGNATIMSAGTSEVTINGGTISIKDGRVPGNGNTWTSCLTDAANTAKIIVNGGTFNGGVRVQDGATMTINGGSFNDVYGSNYNIYGTVTVTGGTFTDDTAKAFATKYVAEGFELKDNGTVAEAAVVVTPASQAELQAALDNCAPGTTINLSAGVEYGVVYMRPSAANRATKVIDWLGNNYVYETYTCYEGLTINGAEGAVIDAIVIEGNTYYNSAHSQANTYPVMLSLIELKNVVIDGVTFTGKGGYDPQGYGNAINVSGNNIKVNGLTIQNCVFNNSENNARLLYKTESTTHVHTYTYGGETYTFTPDLKNITITGCTFNGGYMGLELRETENLIISGNTFNGVSSRDMLLPANDGCTYTGVLTITNNTSNGAGNRFVRAQGVGAVKLTIKDNVIVNYQGGDDDFIKVDGITSTSQDVVIENNTFDGEAVDYVLENGVLKVNTPILPVAKIGETPYTTLAEAVAALKNGETLTITANVTPGANEFIELNGKTNITLAAAEGVVINGNIQVGYHASHTDNNVDRSASTFTVDGLTVKGTLTVLSNDANLVVKNSEAAQITVKTYREGMNIAINGNTADGSMGTAANSYGMFLVPNATGYNLTVDGNTFKNVNSHAFVVQGCGDGSAVTAANSIVVTNNNFESWGTGGKADRAAFKIWADTKYAPAESDLNGTTNAMRELVIAIAAGNNTYSEAENTVQFDAYGAAGDADDFPAPMYAVAKIGETGYASLAEAVAAVKEGETITILAGTHSEGTIKLPATLKNVTIKGTEGAILKDMTISAADGNSYSYIGLTFDGITFDNSRLLFTGWRNGEETIENLAVTNCTFKNLNDDTNTAPVHINKDAAEAVKNFTFTNNVIDGATGGSKSGIYAQVTGEVIITGNTFNNIVFRPALIQLADCDGVEDNVVISNNSISNTTRLQVYGTEEGPDQGPWTPAGTDDLSIAINGNIFQNINGYYICTWGIKGETDITKNYYDSSDLGGKIYWNNEKPADEAGLNAIGVYPIYKELNQDGTINTESEYTPVFPVAEVNGVKCETLAEAVAAAQAGATITLLSDATISEKLTLPAGITFNGNGKAITGAEVWADGNLTFVGHTKVQMFNAGYNKPTITIGEGACLELTSTGRMVIGHGATFNITGNITDAKTANVADLTPSLIMAGASFTGAGVNFNVTNAYIKATAYCSSKNSNASGTFNFNIENSIWEQTGSFVFTEPTNGKDPIFNLNFKDGVLNSTSHLVFAVTKGAIIFDNSNVNGESARRQIENRSTMTIKNGAVVYGAVATSSNAKNPGTLIVDNATYNVTGEFSGSDVGTGTLIVKKGANVTAEKITNANIVIDAAEMTAGELANFTANLSAFAGELSVINNNSLEAKIVDGKIVLAEKLVAKIGDAEYTTLAAAVEAAQAGDVVTLLDDVVLTTGITVNDKALTLDGNGYSIAPAGEGKLGYQAVYFYGGVDATYTIKNVTFKNFVQSNVDGPILRLESADQFNLVNVTFDNCDVAKEAATTHSIMRVYNTDFEADNLTITNCKGGMMMDIGPSSDSFVGNIVIKNSKFEGNTAIGTALIYPTLKKQENSLLTISNTKFNNNVIGDANAAAPQGRGVIHLGSNSNISDCVFDGNSVYGSHASNVVYGINEFSGYEHTFTNNTFMNSAAYQTNAEVGPVSGAAMMAVGTAVLKGNTVENNNKFYHRASADAQYEEKKVRSVGSYSTSYGLTTIESGTYYGALASYGEGKTFEVSGGTFNTEVPAVYCADGFVCQRGDNDLYGIVVAPVVKMGNNGYASVKDALEAAKAAGLDDVEITIVGVNTAATKDDFGLYDQTAFNNVTIKQDNGGKAYYFDCIHTGKRAVADGQFVFDGVNIVIAGQYINQCKTVLKNNSKVERSADAKNFIMGEMIVEAGSKYYSQIDAIYAGSLTIDGGNTDGTYNTEADYKTVFFDTYFPFTIKNGAYVLINAANENGSVNLIGGTTSVMASKLDVFQSITINANATLALDIKSVVTTKNITGAGKITVKATGIRENVTVIAADMTGFNGTITVEGGNFEITSEGLVIKEKTLAGAGTEENPYLISNVEELVFFRDKVNSGDTKYNAPGVWVALAANIDLAGTTWTEGIGDGHNWSFDGNFDGKNHTIMNLTVEPYADANKYLCGGLFGYIYGGATIKNLTIENATVEFAGEEGKEYFNVGVLVGFANNNGGKANISDITVKGDIKVNAPNAYGVGAIVGYSYREMGTIENCTVEANAGSYIKGHSFVGGITGYSNYGAAIAECSVKNIEIIGTKYSVGGIAGLVLENNTISECALENVTVSGVANVGNVVGALAAEAVVVENCTADEPLVGGNYSDNKPVEARIGNKYYATLDAALVADGDESVELLVPVTVAKGETRVIDLNGKTVTATVAGQLTKSFAAIQNKGTLTVKDASAEADGKITVSYAGNSFGYGVGLYTISNEGGVLNIEGGTIENTTTVSGSMYDAIDNNSTTGNTVLNISGGEVKCAYIGVRQFANNTTYDNIVNVTGGKVVGGNTSIWMQNPGSNQPKATIAISGDAKIDGRLLAGTSTGFEYEVTGGTFNTDVTDFCMFGYECKANVDGTYGVVQAPRVVSLELIDGEFTKFENDHEITVGTLTYKREFKNANWQPLYVPFEIPVDQLAGNGFEVAYINGVRRDDTNYDGELDEFVMEIIYIHSENPDRVNGSSKILKANYPYFIRAINASSSNYVTMNIALCEKTLYETVEKTYDCTTMTERFEITGNNRQMTAPAGDFEDNYWGVNKGEWYTFGANATLKPFRFYMAVTSRDDSDVTVTAPMKRMSISVRGEQRVDGTTFIYDVDMDEEQTVDYIYDLQGRRVLEPQKGNLYIINGKKVIF